MSDNSAIGWTDATWNPITGCTKVSEGCLNCYAERMAKRLRGRYDYPRKNPFKVTLHPDRLDEPRRWRIPRRIFVCSMGDLFHCDVPDAHIDKVWATMLDACQHIYIVLTKRPYRMYDWLASRIARGAIPNHIWLGVSIENKANIRRLYSLRQHKAKLFVSFEPLLGRIDFDPTGLDWVIIGCESIGQVAGRLLIDADEPEPLAANAENAWYSAAEIIVQRCDQAGVPVFVKQIPTEGRLETDVTRFPLGLQYQRWPAPMTNHLLDCKNEIGC